MPSVSTLTLRCVLRSGRWTGEAKAKTVTNSPMIDPCKKKLVSDIENSGCRSVSSSFTNGCARKLSGLHRLPQNDRWVTGTRIMIHWFPELLSWSNVACQWHEILRQLVIGRCQLDMLPGALRILFGMVAATFLHLIRSVYVLYKFRFRCDGDQVLCPAWLLWHSRRSEWTPTPRH